MTFDKTHPDPHDLHLDAHDPKGSTFDATHLLMDATLHSAAALTGKSMSPGQAQAWGLAGFAIMDAAMHHVDPKQNQAAIDHGNNVASQVQGRSIVTEGDVAAAEAAYGNIQGGMLHPSGSFAQANLSGAINAARSRLEVQRLAQTNGSGDNAYAAQAQFRTPAEYQAYMEQRAAAKKANA